MNTHPDFAVEAKNLEKTIKLIDEEVQRFTLKRPKQKDWALYQLYRLWTNNRARLEEVRGEPYFGRIDFRPLGQSESLPYYIGKVGSPAVVDWRAPIANLFYENTAGRTKYIAPEGPMHGDLTRRRQYRIRSGELLELFDSLIEDSIRRSLGDGEEWADPFLISELGRSAGERLKDIVATIQAEQNRVIRAPYDSIVVVQGVAGSGKTTVALHRVAYLLYNNPVQIKPERVLVLAPNRLFLQYIEALLPDTLGVSSVMQETFESWVQKLVGGAISVSASRGPDSEITRFLKSTTAQPALDAWFERFIERSVLPENDVSFGTNHLIRGSKIKEWFCEDYACWPVMTRLERIKKRLQTDRSRYMEAVKHVSLPTRARRIDESSKGALEAYLKLLPGKGLWLDAWQDFLTSPEGLPGHLSARGHAEALMTAELAAKKKVFQEDLPAIVYLYTRLHGIDERERYHHVVVDEAQDLTPLQCTVLADRCLRPSLTLVGDLSQAINCSEPLNSWAQVVGDSFGTGKLLEFGFTKSYRSTLEIIALARSMLERGGSELPLPEPVLRHGPAPRIEGFADQKAMLDAILSTVDDMSERYRSVALITSDASRARQLHTLLERRGLDLCLISGAESARDGNLLILPIEMSRGLEFDAVIVLDADSATYPQDDRHLRRMYVAVTRALHELCIFYTGDRTPLLPT